jgi:dihydrofolate reductase
MWVTLDGFIAGPNNEMDWVVPWGEHQNDLVSAAEALMLGRVTYESFAGAWPYVPDNAEAPEDLKDYARKLNSMRKIVFSRTLETADWHNSTLKRELVPDEIRAIKQDAEKNIVIYGSASVVQALTNLGLIDEYHLLVHPLILGNGKPLFQNIEQRTALKHVATTTHPSGVVLVTYQSAA